MDRDQPRVSDVLSARPNGRRSLVPSTTNRDLASRKSSGLVESKENVAMGGGSRTPSETSGASHRRSLTSDSPLEGSQSRFGRKSNSISYLRHPESPPDSSRIPRPKSSVPTSLGNEQRSSFLHTSRLAGSTPRTRQPIGMKAAFKLAEQQVAEEERERNVTMSAPKLQQPMGIKAAYRLAEKQDVEDERRRSGKFSIPDAYRMAAAEINQAMAGSPSPAPRTYRLRRGQQAAGGRSEDLSQQLRHFDRSHGLHSNSQGPLNGLFTRNGGSARNNQPATTLTREGSDGSVQSAPQSQETPVRRSAHGGKRLSVDLFDLDAIGQDFSPLPSIEFDKHVDDEDSPIARPTNPSPEKSYNWQLDADFTAGDLQVSNSPRLNLGKTNGGSVGFDHNEPRPAHRSPASPNARRSNGKLEQLRAREEEAANAILPEDDDSLGSKRSNTRLDEIWANEMQATSKRALATSRLDEIRARNAEARSGSPERTTNTSKDSLRGGSLSPDAARSVKDEKAMPVIAVNEPATQRTARGLQNEEDRRVENGRKNEKSQGNAPFSSRDDSYDLLRQLARATSSSPSPNSSPHLHNRVDELEASPKHVLKGNESPRVRLGRLGRRPGDLEFKSSRERLTVEFAGLPKIHPGDDAPQEKRSSLTLSDVDPTSRYEAEMKLFAPLDNHSEKGSIRAPSPALSAISDHIDEETPRANKIVDPLTQPTPHVTGAWVETPATIKVAKMEPEPQAEQADKKYEEESKVQGTAEAKAALEVPEVVVKQEDNDTTRSPRPRRPSVPVRRRRTRSSSRRRRPLVNTAVIPTVKDDLRSILRKHQIDDSTIDSFDDLLASQHFDPDELERMVNDTKAQVEKDLEEAGLTDAERELQTYDRMSKSLQTGLLGIRSAKQGIERLEDKVAQSESKTSPQFIADLGLSSSSKTPLVRPLPQDANVLLIHLPPLYRRDPKFRLTPFGVLVFILSIWYTIESAFCFLYVAPTDYCTELHPCDWSPNEPYFPYAMPFMVDEWTTGGKGRALAWHIGEEIGDYTADVFDWLTGHDVTEEDEFHMNVWQRKRHRRRMKKHGLIPRWIEPPEYRETFKSWRQAWQAKQRALDDGDGDGSWQTEDERMSADEVL